MMITPIDQSLTLWSQPDKAAQARDQHTAVIPAAMEQETKKKTEEKLKQVQAYEAKEKDRATDDVLKKQGGRGGYYQGGQKEKKEQEKTAPKLNTSGRLEFIA